MNLLQYCFCFLCFWFLWHVEILASQTLSIYDRTAGELTAEYKEAASGLSVSLTEDDRAIVAERNTAAVYSLKTAG